MSELAGLHAPVFAGDNVRTITEADRAVIRDFDDPEPLLELQLKLRTGRRMRGRRPVLLAAGATAILAGMLIIAAVDSTLIAVVLVLLVGLLAVGFVLQSRARKRVIAAIGWIGPIDFRLAQLAARQQ